MRDCRKVFHENRSLTPDLLYKMDAYWRAANYLSVGQIYLYDNPLLSCPLSLVDIKRMLLGHCGTPPPGQNFICVHLNRVISQADRLDPLANAFMCGSEQIWG